MLNKLIEEDCIHFILDKKVAKAIKKISLMIAEGVFERALHSPKGEKEIQGGSNAAILEEL